MRTFSACTKNVRKSIEITQSIEVYLYPLSDFTMIVISAIYHIVSLDKNKTHKSIQLTIK